MEQTVRFLPPQVQLSNAIRRFWVDVNRLIRIYITRTIFNVGVQESKDGVNESFRRIANGLRNLLAQYYGEDVANQVQADFLDYIYHLQQMIEAYADGDEQAIARHRNDLYFLTNRFAQSYAVINNYYDRAVIQALFHELIHLVENQVVSIMNEDYVRDLEEYEKFMDVTYRLADEFVYGILRQFFYEQQDYFGSNIR
ncbi:MAG: hypothetical protein AAGU77_06510 [Bacillota bacterium]